MATWQHLRSSTANKRPTTSLADGRIAINTNTASPGLFFKDSAGTGIVKVGPVHVGTTAPNSVPASGGSTGNYLGEQWLDTSVSPAQMKVWNGSTWVGIVADELPVSKLQDGAARQLIQTDAAGTGVEWTSNVDVPGTLDVTSTATFDSIAQHPLGSAAAPTLTFTGDNNTGIYSPGADQVAISTSGAQRLVVDASGNVGLGVTPSGKFHIGGVSSAIVFNKNGSGTDNALLYDNSVATNDLFLGKDSSNVIIRSAGTERLRITSAGLVGIGTSSPSTKLSVVGSATGLANGAIRTNTTGGTQSANSGLWLCGNQATAHYNWLIASQYNVGGALEITPSTAVDGATFSTPTAVFTHTGRVGIGTTSPGFDLTVDKDSNSLATAYVRSYNTGSSAGGRLIAASALGDLSMTAFSATHSVWPNTAVIASGSGFTGGLAIVAGGTSPLQLYTNGTERARIDSSGRLLVGTTTALTNIYTGATATTPQIQLSGAGLPESSLSLLRTGTTGATIFLNAGSSGSTVLNSSLLGRLIFNGFDGTDYRTGGQITCEADGTPSTADMPGRLVFSTTADGVSSPTEQLRITSDRYVRLASGTGGIQFNGDTAAANALDDYEEGTWTPALAGSTTAGTYETTFASGWYTKIGRQVTVQFRINLAGSITGGGVGFALITGLPFNTSTDNYANGGSVLLGSVDFNDAAKHLYLYKRSTTSGQLVISEVLDNAAPQDVNIADFAASSIIAGSLVYFIS